MRVLVVEDDPRMAAALARGLKAAGMVTDLASNGADALDGTGGRVGRDGAGRDAARRRRLRGLPAPASRRGVGADHHAHRARRGQRSGARPGPGGRRLPDQALLTGRAAGPPAGAGAARGARAPGDAGGRQPGLDPAKRRVWRGESEIALTAREFALLEAFMRRAGQALSRLTLLEAAWDYDYEHRSNVIEVYVGYLRDKMDRPFGLESLETVRGVGYRLRRDGGG